MKNDAIIIPLLLALVFAIAWLVVRARNRKLRAQIDAGNRAYARLEGKVQELERQLRESKLDGLQIMLNPHSFRNTLYSIQSLAKKTLHSVDSLAGILDYMLYDAQQRFVPLEKELKFAKEYLQLYRNSLSQSVKIKADFGTEENESYYQSARIPPMLFAHFIENAFKHGDKDSEDAFIHLKLEVLPDNHIVYSVRNRIGPKDNQQKGGLGYQKLKERLTLLYPDTSHYHLDHKPEGEIYSANLKLRLHEK